MSDHTTTIRTDFEPSEVIVRGGDGRWHKVLNDLWDAGIVASISDCAWRTLGAILRFRTDDRPDCIHAPLGELMRLTGYKSKSRIYDGLTELTDHPAGLLARVGPDLYHALPGWQFAGRRGLSGNPDSRFRDLERKSELSETASGNARAPNPTPEEKTEIKTGAVIPSGLATVSFVERYARARRIESGLGWAGFPLIWNLEGCLSPRLALGCLEVGDPARDELLARIPDLTVSEIDHVARAIKANVRGVANPPKLLCWRLARAHGKHMPKRERGDERARSLEELRERRVQEAVRAAGGRRDRMNQGDPHE